MLGRVLGYGAAGRSAAGTLSLLAREGAGTTSLQQCMIEVWYGDGLVDMKAMSMASYIDLYRQPVCKRTNCVVPDVLRPAFTMLTTCVRSADRFSMPGRHTFPAWLCLTGIVLGAGTEPEEKSIRESVNSQYYTVPYANVRLGVREV